MGFYSGGMKDFRVSRAFVVWLAAVLVYLVAITGRTSFGVSGVFALDRFGVGASQLAVFASVQVGVYALSQIAMGLLIDRFGPRRLLAVGAVVMALGQVWLGLASSFGWALAARVLIGVGDASAFLSVMRLIPEWFSLRRAPLVAQTSAALGQLGQFLSAVPFLALLKVEGWTVAFVSLGAVGVLVGLAAWLLVRDSPRAGVTRSIPVVVPFGVRLGRVLRSPVCWQAFFVHWMGLLPLLVFALLWGVPLMTLGLGWSAEVAGLVLVLCTAVNVVAGPLLGAVSPRLGGRRELVAVALSGSIVVGFLVFFTVGGYAGWWLILAVVLLGCFSPASNYGFDTVRERLDGQILATGTGLANMGGFTAGMLAAQLVGALLEWRGDFSVESFALAWWALPAVWLLGLLGFWVSRRKVLASGC